MNKKLKVAYSNINETYNQNLKNATKVVKAYGGEVRFATDNDNDFTELDTVTLNGNHGAFNAFIMGAKIDKDGLNLLYMDVEDIDTRIDIMPLSWMDVDAADYVCQVLIEWYNNNL